MISDHLISTKKAHHRIWVYIGSRPLWFLLPFSLVYLSGNLFVPMLLLDEAQQADYVNRVAQGIFPYRDFLDIYGPLNWFPPAFFYQMFGQQWFGVRVYMLLLHLVILILVFRIVRRIGDTFWAVTAYLTCLAFLAAPLDKSFTPYAFMQIYPLCLGMIWYLAVVRRRLRHRYAFIAGTLSGIALFFKISSGLFLWLGGLMICFYHQGDLPAGASGRKPGEKIPPFARGVFAVKWMGILVYLAVFTAYLLPHYEKPYFFHLTLPTLAALGVVIYGEYRRFQLLSPGDYIRMERYRLAAWGMFFLGSISAAAGIFLLFMPSGMSLAMVRILPDILKESAYFMPFPPLFVVPDAPILAALTRGGWFVLAWIVTGLCGMIIVARYVTVNGIGGQSQSHDAVCGVRLETWGHMFLVGALTHYVIYPTPDTGHLIQSLVIWLFLLVTGVFFLEHFLGMSCRGKVRFRWCVAMILLVWCLPLIRMTLPRIVQGAAGMNGVPCLSCGDYLSAHGRMIDDGEYYLHLIDVADFIKDRLKPGDHVLTLSRDKQVNLYAGQPLYGGRDSFLFYLVPHERISRESYERLADPRTLKTLLVDPPRYIVNHDYNGGNVFRDTFPEIDTVLKTRYAKVFHREQIWIYERVD